MTTYDQLKTAIFADYEIRKGKRRKLAFIEFVRKLCADEGLAFKVEESGSLMTSRNIIIGDPENADHIVTAHYDTCARMILPNFITPRNIVMYLVYQILLSAILLAPAFAAMFLLMRFTDLDFAPLLVFYALLFAPVYLLMAGPANPHTANDNTSGVICVLMSAIQNKGNRRIAFILFDNEELGLLGSAAYAKSHRDIAANKPVINLDCISDGENILLHINKKLRNDAYFVKMADRFSSAAYLYGKTPVVPSRGVTIYPSDQMNFKKGVAIASLKSSRLFRLYMDRIHTSRDVKFDDTNIECILAFISSMANGL